MKRTLFELPRSEILVDIARRVDYLTLLYSVDVATYRHAINLNATNMHVSALDYTSVDYDYVAIARKTRQECIGALVAMPGKKISAQEIKEVLRECGKIQSSIPIPSYILKAHRLVMDSYRCLKHLLAFFEDVCPRTGKVRLCFSIAFLKQIIPDLLGDTSFQPFMISGEEEEEEEEEEVTTLLVSIGPCVICLEQKRDVLFMPCHHLIACSRCSDKIQNIECPVCKRPITNTEKIYT